MIWLLVNILRKILCYGLVILLLGTAAPAAADASVGVVNVKGESASAAVEALIVRVLGVNYSSSFNVTVDRALNPTRDAGVIRSASTSATQQQQQLSLRCSTGVGCAATLYQYVKYACLGSVTWGYAGSGDQLRLPAVLPSVNDSRFDYTGAMPHQYAWNACTFSYTAAFWDWARWERELDWLALHGYNLPLASTGQEHVFFRLWTERYGLEPEDLVDFFAGPAFLAWNRMANINDWLGGLTEGFMQAQSALQLRILRRMAELQMTPVLPGFGGSVPKALIARFPDADIAATDPWKGFPTPYAPTYMLDPTDPLFLDITQGYMQLQQELYGAVTSVYGVDVFNEHNPPSDDPAYLTQAAVAVYKALRAGDSSAVWLMQGWLFKDQFWTDALVEAFLTPKVPRDAWLLLDLQAEVDPFWPTFVAQKKNFIWCLLHNFGGNRGIYGDLEGLSSGGPLFVMQEKDAAPYMLGIGMAPEAIEHNPVVFELFSEMNNNKWRSSGGPSVQQWVLDYARRRYPDAQPALLQAWRLLARTWYTDNWGGNHHKSLYATLPNILAHQSQDQNATALVQAWALLLEGSAGQKDHTPFAYDLVDVGRQSLANLFSDVFLAYNAAVASCSAFVDGHVVRVARVAAADLYPLPHTHTYTAGLPLQALVRACLDYRVHGMGCAGVHSNGTMYSRVRWQPEMGRHGTRHPLHGLSALGESAEDAGFFYLREQTPSRAAGDACAPGVESLAAVVLQLIQDIDALLATNVNFLLGVWTGQAARASPSDAPAGDFLANAKNQVTLWGPHGEENDYATKEWAGLAGDYFGARYSLLLDAVHEGLAHNSVVNFTAVREATIHMGQQWYTAPATYPNTTSGSSLGLATRLFDQYAGAGAANVTATFTRYKHALLKEGTLQKHTLLVAWTSNVNQLALLCDWWPACDAFTSSGVLLAGIDPGEDLIPKIGREDVYCR
jgi:alpha-N-acetylglucosaminidase